MNRIFANLATFALVSAVLATTAFAHAKFVSSTPAPGQTVAARPQT